MSCSMYNPNKQAVAFPEHGKTFSTLCIQSLATIHMESSVDGKMEAYYKNIAPQLGLVFTSIPDAPKPTPIERSAGVSGTLSPDSGVPSAIIIETKAPVVRKASAKRKKAVSKVIKK